MTGDDNLYDPPANVLPNRAARSSEEAMELVGLGYSPWSEKARWALDHHRIAYTYREYVPMLGELPLRIRAGRMSGKITVPILFDDDRVVGDSFAIAQYAESAGSGAPLFSAASLARITEWNAKSELALAAGRGLVITRTTEDKEAQRESVPKFIPPALRGASLPMVTMGTRYLARKHGTLGRDAEAAERAMDDTLASLRGALGGREYLLDSFSYADVVMAVVLQMVEPVSDAFLPLDPATRRCWTTPALAKKHADLVAWRDALYAKHRPKRA
jgi:glutathione S-transferase